MTNNQYPDWQAEIRKAQMEMQLRREQELQEQQKREAERERRKQMYAVRNFCQVLRWLGITAEPNSDEIEIGDFIFTLKAFITNKETGDSQYPEVRYHKIEEARWVKFQIMVEREPDKLPPDDDYDIHVDFSLLQQTVDVSMGFDAPPDWTAARAALADALDAVNAGYEQFNHQVFVAHNEAAWAMKIR